MHYIQTDLHFVIYEKCMSLMNKYVHISMYGVHFLPRPAKQ